jgi:subtilase family serine protease
VVLVSLAAATAPRAVAGANPAAPATPASAAVCPPAGPGYAACLSLYRTDIPARSRSQVTPLALPSGYGPASLQSAYNLPGFTVGLGTGETVAIVDAYDQPNAASDLAQYRSVYSLPQLGPCGSGSPCFQKVNQTGGTNSYPTANSGWGLEISLDIEMVSAICPNCNILLVEATSASWSDLGTAENYAANKVANPGVVAISNSYGGSEGSGETSTDAYYNHAGIAVIASSGDGGYGVEYPAASQYVVAVGGTTLNTATNTRGWTESAWSGAGSGCSAYESKPTWQADYGCTRRTVADVSAVANPNTGVAVFDDYGSYTGWYVVGGTSVSSPIIASTYALAGTTPGTYPAQDLYQAPADLWDVTSVSNGSCSPSYLCTAVVGYDGPTGLGTPDGTGAFTSGAATAPGAPMNVTATAGNGQATVSFSPPAASGGSAITGYTVTGSPSGPVIGSASPITVTGLTNGQAYTFTVQATNTQGSGAASAPSNSVTPTSSTAPLTITTTSLPTGHLNKFYSASVTATGGVGPYSWTIYSGALPPGLALGLSNGTISGYPTLTGTFSFTVTVTDNSTPTRQTTSKAFSIKILRK